MRVAGNENGFPKVAARGVGATRVIERGGLRVDWRGHRVDVEGGEERVGSEGSRVEHELEGVLVGVCGDMGGRRKRGNDTKEDV